MSVQGSADGRNFGVRAARRTVLRTASLGALGALAAIVSRPARAQAGVSETEILIGQSAQLSGPLAPLTQELRQGASWYLEDLNARGGVHGRTVRVVTLDDGYVAARTAENVRRLIDEDQVLALFNLAGTPTTLAALPILEARRVPLVAPFTGADVLRTGFSRYVFNLRAGYGSEIAKIVQHLSTIGIDKIAVAYLNNAFGKSALAAAGLAAKSHGVAVVASTALEVDGKGLELAVRSVAQAGPQAVVVATAGRITSDFIASYQQVRAGMQFYALSVVSSQQLLKDLGDRSRGVVIAQVMPHPVGGQSAAARELAIFAKQGGGHTVTHNHMEGFLSAKVLVEGLRRAGRALDRTALVRGLESMREVDLGGYVVRYSDRNHNGSNYVELSVVGASGRLVK
jgi:branched-chain amino acid transport system substrate-binding protein